MKKLITSVGFLLLFLFVVTANSPAQALDSLQLQKATLYIESIPSQASLIMDSDVVGKTPITLQVLEGSHHKIRMQKPGYIPFQIEITPMPKDSFYINAILEKFSGSVAVITENDESVVNIDGNEVGIGCVDSLSLEPGVHEVTVFNPTRGSELTSLFQIEQTGHCTLKAEYAVPSSSRLVLSFLLPGYAQLDDRNESKGIAFVLAAFGVLGYSASEYFTFVRVEKNYKSALDAYDLAYTDKDVEQTRNVADRKESEYKVMRNRFGISLGALAVVWLANAVDITLNHLLSDRIKVLARSRSLQKTTDMVTDFQCTVAFRIQ